MVNPTEHPLFAEFLRAIERRPTNTFICLRSTPNSTCSTRVVDPLAQVAGERRLRHHYCSTSTNDSGVGSFGLPRM